jgi:hypothetical protein
MTKKGEATVIQTSIETSIEEAIGFAQEILNSTKTESYYVIQMKKDGTAGANYVYGPFDKEKADKEAKEKAEAEAKAAEQAKEEFQKWLTENSYNAETDALIEDQDVAGKKTILYRTISEYRHL